MPSDPSKDTTGLIKIRDHCLFTWHGSLETGERAFERQAGHCEDCVAALGDQHGPVTWMELDAGE